MALTLDKLIGANRQILPMFKSNSITTTAGQPFTMIDRAGYPAAGSLDPASVVSGTVPTDATTGFPTIDAFSGGNRGFLSHVDLSSPGNGTYEIYDVLFWAGRTTIPTNGTTTVTLTSVPSFATRVPFKSDGTTRDYNQVQIFLQASVAWSNHAHTTSVSYLDQDGNAGSTGNISTQNLGINRWLRMPLASGDTGVQGITSYAVNGITSSSGAVTVVCARRLFGARTVGNNTLYGPDQTGCPEVFADSALLLVCRMDGTTSSTPYATITISEMAP
jgi:hypothetical protein